MIQGHLPITARNEPAPRHGQTRQERDLILQFRKKLETLSENQEELAEAREALLLEREAFRSRGSRVHTQRVRTGDAEVAFMDQVRKFFNEYGTAFPPALQTTYDSLQIERDKMGSLETDYLHTEEVLTGKEWTYMEQENDFFQYELPELFSDKFFDSLGSSSKPEPQPPHLVPESAPNSSLIPYQAALAEHEHLTKEFDALRLEYVQLFPGWDVYNPKKDPTTQQVDVDAYFANKSSNLLTKITSAEVKIQWWKGELMHQTTCAILKPHQDSDTVQFSQKKPSPLECLSQAHLDGKLPILLQSLPVKQKVRDWLCDYLKNSALGKAQYLNILEQELDFYGVLDFNFTSWRDTTFQHWGSEVTDHPIQPEEDLPVMTQSSQHNDNDRQSAYSQNIPSDEPSSYPLTVKPGLDFDANFNYAPIPTFDESGYAQGFKATDIPLLVGLQPEPEAEYWNKQSEGARDPSLIARNITSSPTPDNEINSPSMIPSVDSSGIQVLPGLLQAPAHPRYDSAQQSDAEESRRPSLSTSGMTEVLASTEEDVAPTNNLSRVLNAQDLDTVTSLALDNLSSVFIEPSGAPVVPPVTLEAKGIVQSDIATGVADNSTAGQDDGANDPNAPAPIKSAYSSDFLSLPTLPRPRALSVGAGQQLEPENAVQDVPLSRPHKRIRSAPTQIYLKHIEVYHFNSEPTHTPKPR